MAMGFLVWLEYTFFVVQNLLVDKFCAKDKASYKQDYDYLHFVAWGILAAESLNSLTFLMTSCYLLWMTTLDQTSFKKEFKKTGGQLNRSSLNASTI